MVSLTAGNVSVWPSVPLRVRLLVASKVLPLERVNVPVVVVIVREG